MKPDVSVVICARNAEKYIHNCISSLLDQTYENFEIIIVDDMSTDNTANIIRQFSDKRLKYYRNKEWLKIAKSRNRGLKHANGKYVFLTDADCTVSRNWIQEGVKYFEDKNCVGVEGKIHYVSKDYEPTFSDHALDNKYGGQFMTASAAYRKDVIMAVRGFDERLSYLHDRDIALRIMKHGKIRFNPNMTAYHPQVIMTPKTFIKSAPDTKNRIILFKRFGERKTMHWRVLEPFNLAKIVFPPLVLASLFFNRYRTREDLALLPYTYIRAILERLQIWKTCATERVFLI